MRPRAKKQRKKRGKHGGFIGGGSGAEIAQSYFSYTKGGRTKPRMSCANITAENAKITQKEDWLVNMAEVVMKMSVVTYALFFVLLIVGYSVHACNEAR